MNPPARPAPDDHSWIVDVLLFLLNDVVFALLATALFVFVMMLLAREPRDTADSDGMWAVLLLGSAVVFVLTLWVRVA